MSCEIVVMSVDALAARDMLASADHVVVKPFDVILFKGFLDELLRV
jgi:hypothetical protein